MGSGGDWVGRELTASCEGAGGRHQRALLEIEIHPDQPASRLQDGYPRWLGADRD